MAERIRAHVRWLKKEVSRTDRELDEAIGEREAWGGPTQGLAGGHNVRTDAGGFSLYLAFILDTHSRRIVGWSMDSHMRTELVVEPLEIAVWRCKLSAGLVHHCDRGIQYTAISFSKRLAEVGITPPMGRTGTALDNARAESFIATLKTELVHRRRFPDPEVASSVIFEYLEGFYNQCRSHSALSYRSAADYEEATMEGAAAA